MRRRRHSWRASALHTGDACALVGPARQAWASLFVVGGPRGSHGRGRRLGSDAAFWIRHPCGVTRGFDTRLGGQGGAMRRGGVLQRARHVSFARAPKSEVTAIPRRGFGGSPGDGRAGTEFGPNLERIGAARDRGRSAEIDRDRPRSTEIDRDRPIFAQLVRPPGLLTQFGRC